MMIEPQLLRAVIGAIAAVLLSAAPLPVAAQAGGGDYRVGDRLASPAHSGKAAAYREISWDDLIPADWNPERFLAELDLDALEDNDPRAAEAMQRMREEWDRAPVVERLGGERVRIPGFVVALEGDGGTIREFLLVPYFGACVHVPPPPANQLIHVVPAKPLPAAWNMMPVWVNGVMAVGRVDSEMGRAGYQLRAVAVEEYKDPLPR